MAVSLTQVLEASLSGNNQRIEEAGRYIREAIESNFSAFLLALSKELVNMSNDGVVRTAAGIQLKNFLASRDEALKNENKQKWLQSDAIVRQEIKNNILNTLGTEPTHPSTAALVICFIACVELPEGQWPDLIHTLLTFVTNVNNTEQLKEATLEALGYLCEEISPHVIATQANHILTAIIQGMRREESSNRVRLAACKALNNSLDFTKANFDTEHERHVIMQVVCEATQSEDTKVRVAALQNLVKIMSLYYQHMEHYMGPALFAITIDAMKSEDPEISLQGIEFWSTVCDEEENLSYEAAEAKDQGRTVANQSKHYVRGALSYLAPILLELMTKQGENDDEDDWNPCKAAGVCIMLMSNVAENEIVSKVMPFINRNIKSPDWRYRDASVMCLGSILDGPDPQILEEIVSRALDVMIELLDDPVNPVKDTAAWAVGRMCEEFPMVVVRHNLLNNLLAALLTGLDSVPRVATNICWAFIALAEGAYNAEENDTEDEPATYSLSAAYQQLISKLISCTERTDSSGSNLRSAAYETLIEVIRYSAKDCYPVIQSTTLHILEKLSQTFQCSTGDRSQIISMQSYLCATLQSLLRKITPSDAFQIADTVMRALLYILETTAPQNDSILEDVMLTIGTVIESIGKDFQRYMSSFKPHLINAIQNCKEYHVCIAAVGCVDDLTRALPEELKIYSEELMAVLTNALSEKNLNENAKTHIISVFGDIALAIGPRFKDYLEAVLTILHQACQFEVDRNDFSQIEYLNELRDSCLDAYIGIIQGLKENGTEISPDLQLIFPHVPFLIRFIDYIGLDPIHSTTNVGSACGLLGDLIGCFGNEIASELKNKTGIDKILYEGRNCETEKTKLYASWATQAIRKLQSGLA